MVSSRLVMGRLTAASSGTAGLGGAALSASAVTSTSSPAFTGKSAEDDNKVTGLVCVVRSSVQPALRVEVQIQF